MGLNALECLGSGCENETANRVTHWTELLRKAVQESHAKNMPVWTATQKPRNPFTNPVNMSGWRFKNMPAPTITHRITKKKP